MLSASHQTYCDCPECTAELGRESYLGFDLSALEATTDDRIASLDDRQCVTESITAAITYNLDQLKADLHETQRQLEVSKSKAIIHITTRRYRIAKFMRYMALTAIGFAAILTIGAAISGSQSQKDEYAEVAVLTGLGAVVGLAIVSQMED